MTNSEDCEEIVINPIEFEREVCEGDTFSISALVTGSDMVYQWQYSVDNGVTWMSLTNDSIYGGVTSATLVFQYSYLILSGYYYRLLATNDCSVINSTSFVLTVIAKPVANVAPTDGLNFCVGDTTGASSFTNGSFIWSNGELTSVIEITTPGDYFIIASLNGCVDTSNILTFIEHDYPTASFTASATSFCTGDSVLLTSAYANGNIWSNETYTEEIYILEGGDYFLIVDQFGCVDTSSILSIVMLPLPDVTLTPLATICDTDPVVTFLTGLPSGGIYYLDGIQTDSFDPHERAGTYQLTYVYNDGSCTDSASLTFEVSPCSSVESLTAIDLMIYPNPFKTHLKIEGDNLMDFEIIEVYDHLGRLIQTIDVLNDVLTIEAMKWESGLYVLSFSGNVGVYMQRVLKE